MRQNRHTVPGFKSEIVLGNGEQLHKVVARLGDSQLRMSTFLEILGQFGDPPVSVHHLVIVAQDQKQRYSIRNGWIRANQGHSVAGVCAVELLPVAPPEVLYHGTTTQRWQAIQASDPPGLKPGSRHHVHLSHDLAVAKQVGSRHRREELVVLQVDAKGFAAEGGIFYRSENGVWLTDFVPLDYLAVL